MWRRRKRALKGERVTVYAQLVNMMSRIVTHNRLRDGSLKNAIFANRPNKRVEGKISIQVVHSIQLGFSRLLGSAAFNEANKGAVWSAEWTITTRQAVPRLAQMKYRIFCSRI